MTGRLLVVNADDFGLTPGINAGIVALVTDDEGESWRELWRLPGRAE